MRHTSTSTSNYDHSSDIACNFERPRTGNTQHTSDSESEVRLFLVRHKLIFHHVCTENIIVSFNYSTSDISVASDINY